MASVRSIGPSDALVYVSIGALLFIVVRRSFSRRVTKTTPLRGPKNPSFFYGALREMQQFDEFSEYFSECVSKFGSIFRVPGSLGRSRIVLCDPKATTFFYQEETWRFRRSSLSYKFIALLFGEGLLWAEANDHKRQRKALSPAFSVAAIRHLTSVFFDSTYKAKAAWDCAIEATSTDHAVIEVQDWMNRIALDSIGIAGFSHDFGTLSGEPSAMLDIFNSLSAPTSQRSKIGLFLFFLSFYFPSLLNIPTESSKVIFKLKSIMSEIADALLMRTREERAAGIVDSRAGEKSIIGLLIKAENKDTELNMTEQEVLAQMNTLLFAGFETTSGSLTWALIELSRNQPYQNKLREELMNLGTTDPTYEQLMHGLPFLDAVVHEILRLHPPVSETLRQAHEDIIIPLSKPITTATGELVSNIFVQKGETVSAPIRWLNRCEEHWGPDAAVFNPNRWLDDKCPRGAKEINAHRKLLTFSDGPRICLGKHFALAEFKSVLSVLVKNYEFSLPNGPNTKISIHMSLLLRAKVEGEEGMRVPLIVRRLK